MTHEQKLEAVSKDIRTKLPELMEVSRGCWFSDDDCNYQIDGVFDDNVIFHNVDGNQSYNHYKRGFYEDEYEILGHDIQLHHVLKWWTTLEIFKSTEEDNVQIVKQVHFGAICGLWNLDKLLKDQSKELIDYLYSLIK